MNEKLLRPFFLTAFVALITLALPSAVAAPPTSAEQLRSELESAVKAKDKDAVLALVNWQGVSDDMKSMMKELDGDLCNHDIASVTLTALPPGFQPTNEMNGVRYVPNVDIVGMIEVEYTEKGNNMQMPYGTKDGAFYISGTVEEKTGASAVKEKSLDISVMGSAMPDAGTFTGSYVYVKDGKEIKEDLSGKGNISKAFRGDYVKSCTVRNDSNSQDGLGIQLTISEDGNTVFESDTVTNTDPIVYEKK